MHMNLVNQLQEAAKRDDVLNVLRKAKCVSAKLGRKDLCRWVEYEQNGYLDADAVPEYRLIPVTLCYKTNSPVPADCDRLGNGIVSLSGIVKGCDSPIIRPISDVLNLVESIKFGQGMFIPLPPEVTRSLHGALKCNKPDLFDQVKFMARLDDSHVRAIPEHIKKRVLDWACDLEAAGVTGDDQAFSNKEKETAQTVIFNINNSSIDQLNNSGNNIKGE